MSNLGTVNTSDTGNSGLGCFSVCGRGQAVPTPQKPRKPLAHDHPALKEIDTLIAKDMFQMSLQDRESALNDVHGVGQKEKDAVFVNFCLGNMEEHLSQHMNSMGNNTTSAYAEAEQMLPSFVRDRKFRLMFLRAEHWNPKQAADRMIKFFALKKRLFGSSKLVKRITLSDLNDDDMTALRTGEGQISSMKDSAGRVVATFCHNLRQCKDLENSRRAVFYIYMAAMESTEAQTRGIVGIFYLLDSSQVKSINSEIRRVLPIYFASLHLCVNDVGQYVKASAAIFQLSKENRVRYRLHYGSHMECLYELISFGIPRNALPVNNEGEYSINEHLAWIEHRIDIDAAIDRTHSESFNFNTATGVLCRSVSMTSSFSIGEDIHPNDVLLGRGKHAVDHLGNAKFRKLVDAYLRKYEEAERFEKTCIAEAIVGIIHDSQGRFLKKGTGSDWEEIDRTEARKKVAHAFRNRRKVSG